MCDNTSCTPITLTVTITSYAGSATSLTTPLASGLGLGHDSNNPSIGSQTLAAGTDINNSSSIALDTTVRVTATSTNTNFITNTLSSSSTRPSASASKATTSLHPTSTPAPSNGHMTKGAVAGSIIGALCALALLPMLLLFCCQHRKKLKIKFRLKRKGSDASSLDEKAKELKVREEALKEAEVRKSMAGFVGPTFGGGLGAGAAAGGGYVIGKALGSPTGTGESGGGTGMRRRSQDAREQVGRWI